MTSGARDPTPAQIAEALGGAKRDGAGWRCRCPAHDDRDPSLAITERDGKLLCICRAGCHQDAVITALRQRGLWPEPQSVGASRIIATYPYHDPDGILRYQVVRLSPKKFFQRRPNGVSNNFINNMEGVDPLPYRLPELLEDPVATVFIPEGEKDVDNLAAIGIVATCNHGGVGKWRKEISHWLAGRRVVILPDNDEVGRNHARDIAQKLAGIAASIRTLELPGLPPKGDVSDWLAAGGTADGLEQLACVPENNPLDLGEWDAGDDDAPIPPRQWLLGNLFCRQFISSLLGDGAVGKTSFRIVCALAMVTGRVLTGDHVFGRSRVLLICFEDGKDELRRRVRAAMLHYGIAPADIRGWLFLATITQNDLKLATVENGVLRTGQFVELLSQVIVRRQIDALILDPFVKTHAVPENDNNAIDFVAGILSDLAIRHNIAVDAPHHTRKGPVHPGDADTGRGASSLKDGGRLVYTLTKMTPDQAKLFNLGNEDAARLMRLDSAKVNLAPPAAAARWFRLIGVPIGNGSGLYPNGDEVQTVERWTPPDIWKGLSPDLLNQILDEIDRGLPGDKLFSNHNRAGDRAAAIVVRKYLPDVTPEQAREMLKTWEKNAVLILDTYYDEEARKTKQGLRVNAVNRPGARAP